MSTRPGIVHLAENPPFAMDVSSPEIVMKFEAELICIDQQLITVGLAKLVDLRKKTTPTPF